MGAPLHRPDRGAELLVLARRPGDLEGLSLPPSGRLESVPLGRCILPAGLDPSPLLDRLRRRPEVRWAEEVRAEGECVWEAPPLPAGSAALGIAEAGRPEADHPLLRRWAALRPRVEVRCVGPAPSRRHATAVAVALLAAVPPDTPLGVWWLAPPPAAGPFTWLRALDRLAAAEVATISLSWGRRRVEAAEGWAALERGASALHRATGVGLVVAAGRPCANLPQGFAPHLPGRAAGAAAVDGPRRFAGRPPLPDEEEIVLADDRDPLGGAPGSSFAVVREAVRRAVRMNAGTVPGLC